MVSSGRSTLVDARSPGISLSPLNTMVSHRRLKSTPSDLISPSLQQPNLARSSAIHTPLVDFSPASHRSSWPTSPCICRPPSCRSRSSPVSLHEVGIPPSCLTIADLHHPSYVQLLIELLAPYKYYTIGGRRIVPYLTPADRSYNISRIHGHEHEQEAPFTRRVSRLTDSTRHHLGAGRNVGAVALPAFIEVPVLCRMLFVLVVRFLSLLVDRLPPAIPCQPAHPPSDPHCGSFLLSVSRRLPPVPQPASASLLQTLLHCHLTCPKLVAERPSPTLAGQRLRVPQMIPYYDVLSCLCVIMIWLEERVDISDASYKDKILFRKCKQCTVCEQYIQ